VTLDVPAPLGRRGGVLSAMAGPAGPIRPVAAKMDA